MRSSFILIAECGWCLPRRHFSALFPRYLHKMDKKQVKSIPQFYRRKLPSTCIPFSSPEGKQLFKEALASGHMECYFRLAEQFRTQDEPAFCGLTTLVIVLNALAIDPGKVWKGPWRWYHETMLDCCIPIANVEQDGINFENFICLANCNSLETKARRCDETVTVEEFRDRVIEYSKRDDSFLLISYSRKVLGQTGDGHFSPVGGYHPGRDLVLMLDTARFKYPPHWIPVELMMESMKALDTSTNKPRGFITVAKVGDSPLLTLFRISNSFSVTLPRACTDKVTQFVDSWQDWLRQESSDKVPGNIVEECISHILRCAVKIDDEYILTTQVDLDCKKMLSEEHACMSFQIIEELQRTKLYLTTKEKLENPELKKFKSEHKIGQLVMSNCTKSSRCNVGRLQPADFISVLLISWPYKSLPAFQEGTNAFALNKIMEEELSKENHPNLRNEILNLQNQFSVLMKLHYHNKKCKKESCCPK